MNTKIAILTITLIISSLNLFSQKSNYYFIGGISFPNEKVVNIFTDNKIETTDSIVQYNQVRLSSPETGYNLNFKLSLPLSDKASFFGGFGLYKFKTNEVELYESESAIKTGSFNFQTTIYPLSAGIIYKIYSSKFSVYSLAQLDYNYVVNSLDNIESKYILKLSKESTESQFGFSAGVGFEYSLGNAALILEGLYTNINYIQNSKNEINKQILSIKTGLKF